MDKPIEWSLVPGTDGKNSSRRRYYAFCPQCNATIHIGQVKARDRESRWCVRCKPIVVNRRHSGAKWSKLVHRLQIMVFPKIFSGLMKKYKDEKVALGHTIELTCDENMDKLVKTPPFIRYIEDLKGDALCRMCYDPKPLAVSTEKILTGMIRDIDIAIRNFSPPSMKPAQTARRGLVFED